MSITQISAFVENHPGRIKRLTDILGKVGVNIRGFSAADTADFGIVRLIVDRPELALSALKGAGILVVLAELLCIELADEPGALDEVFAALADAEINVEYAYSLVSTYIALKVDDLARATEALSGAAIKLVEQSELQC